MAPAIGATDAADPTVDRSSIGVDSRSSALVERLRRERIDVDFERVNLAEAIDRLGRDHDLNLVVDWQHLRERSGVRRDTAVSLRLRDVSIATCLDELVAGLGEHAARRTITWTVRENVIRIGGRDGSATGILRSYDVTDLIESGFGIRRLAHTPVLGLQTAGTEFVGGEERRSSRSEQSGGSLFGGGGPAMRQGTEMERLQELIDLLQSLVAPESWADYGGDEGSVRVYDGRLLVTQTPERHAQLADVLELIRATRPTPLHVDTAIVRLRLDAAAAWRDAVGPSFPVVTAEAVDGWFTDPDAAGALLFRATNAGLAGSTALFSALVQRDLVRSIDPVVQASAPVGRRPVIDAMTTGLELIVLPLPHPDGSGTTVHVNLAMIPPGELTGHDRDSDDAGLAAIDRTRRSMRTISTATRLAPSSALILTIPDHVLPDPDPQSHETWLVVRVREAVDP